MAKTMEVHFKYRLDADEPIVSSASCEIPISYSYGGIHKHIVMNLFPGPQWKKRYYSTIYDIEVKIGDKLYNINKVASIKNEETESS
jgi:hypothetical protein